MKAALTVAVILLAISAEAATVYKNSPTPVDFTYFVPCANAGQGELVHFSGNMLTTLTEATENGWIIGHFHVAPTLSAIGETTGVSYSVVGSQQFTFKLSPGKIQTGNNAMNLSAIGDGVTYHIHDNSKYTFFPDGTVSFAFDNFFVFCQ